VRSVNFEESFWLVNFDVLFNPSRNLLKMSVLSKGPVVMFLPRE